MYKKISKKDNGDTAEKNNNNKIKYISFCEKLPQISLSTNKLQIKTNFQKTPKPYQSLEWKAMGK